MIFPEESPLGGRRRGVTKTFPTSAILPIYVDVTNATESSRSQLSHPRNFQSFTEPKGLLVFIRSAFGPCPNLEKCSPVYFIDIYFNTTCSSTHRS
jgi:hypothetical protein